MSASLFRLFFFVLVALSWQWTIARNLIYDPREDTSIYSVGVGISDVTGPAAGVNMMGYANPSQVSSGIHLRLFSRAFIIDDLQRRFAFASVDCGMMSTNLKIHVVKNLQEVYGTIYDYDNVILSGTHTHSGPGGFHQYLLFDVTSLGFVQESYDALVEGIVESIKMAHENMVSGNVYMTSGTLLNSSINRSPTAYLNNPAEERGKYEYDTDKTMTLIKLVGLNGSDIGMFNWFAVHPTSMNNTNQLISGDNKGYASYLFEKAMDPGSLPGRSSFVAAFAQSNCGDVSPNTKGPQCQDTGEPCDLETSTCGGRVQLCVASGPGKDMVESTKIIGQQQFEKAWELYNSAPETMEKLSGPIQYIHQHIFMDNYTVYYENGSTVQTCMPALGYSFAAGTTDGPGAFDFTQGMTVGNPFWNMISSVLHEPSPEQKICHEAKPILLDTGEMNAPYPWHPHIVDTQVGRIGNLFILAVPGEFTTMGGRRIRNFVNDALSGQGIHNSTCVIAGLSNVYTHYITTYEEYQIQRYEGASTIYGPHTLEAYMQQYAFLTKQMVRNSAVPVGPDPPDLMDEQLTLLPDVIFDGPPIGLEFGDVIAQPYPLAYIGETVSAKFVSGNPRNDVQLGGTFMTVEKLTGADNWTVVTTDADWETRFFWERTSALLGQSLANALWDIPDSTEEGQYRITHQGHYKAMFGGITPYSGSSNMFQVIKPPSEEINKISRSSSIPLRERRGILQWLIRLFL